MSDKQARKLKKRFIIVFYGDEGPQKTTIVEAVSAKQALAQYFFKSGAGQLDSIRNRTRALEEKTFNIIQDGKPIHQIQAVSIETALAWFAQNLNLTISFVKNHCIAEEI